MNRKNIHTDHKNFDPSIRSRAILRYLKQQLGISNKQIAALSGYTPSYLCHVSKGECKASPQLVETLNEVLTEVCATVKVLAMCADTSISIDKDTVSRIQYQIIRSLAKWTSKNRAKIKLPKGVTGVVARVGRIDSDLFVVSLAPNAGEDELDILIHELREIKNRMGNGTAKKLKHKPAW